MINRLMMRWLMLMSISMLACMLLAANLGAMPLSLRTLWQAPLSDLAGKSGSHSPAARIAGGADWHGAGGVRRGDAGAVS